MMHASPQRVVTSFVAGWVAGCLPSGYPATPYEKSYVPREMMPMATVLLQGVPDEVVEAIKNVAAEAGVSPGEVVARLYEFYADLRVSTEPSVLDARRLSHLP
jgi:hypothetical protein